MEDKITFANGGEGRMIERKLSKTQGRIFIALAQQRQELQQAFREIVGAEREQIELLRQHYGLPDGQYRLRQEQNGDVVMYRANDLAKDEENGDD